VAIEKQSGAESLILRRGCNVFGDSKIGEEGFDFRNAHIFWMALLMKQNIALNPLDVSNFGSVGVTLETDSIANLVERLLRWGINVYEKNNKCSSIGFVKILLHYSIEMNGVLGRNTSVEGIRQAELTALSY
jgi:hypothetical protein